MIKMINNDKNKKYNNNIIKYILSPINNILTLKYFNIFIFIR